MGPGSVLLLGAGFFKYPTVDVLSDAGMKATVDLLFLYPESCWVSAIISTLSSTESA